jgi:hypothetical protein
VKSFVSHFTQLTANKEALSIPLPLAVSFSKQFGSLYLPTTKTSGESAGPTPSEASNQTDMNITDDMIVKTAIKEKFRKILGQYFDALSRKAVSDHLVSYLTFFQGKIHFVLCKRYSYV